jgi:hypothetical protein
VVLLASLAGVSLGVTLGIRADPSLGVATMPTYAIGDLTVDEATHEFDHLDLPAVPEHILAYDGQRITAEGDWWTHDHAHGRHVRGPNHPPDIPHPHEHRWTPDPDHHHSVDPDDDRAADGHAADPALD